MPRRGSTIPFADSARPQKLWNRSLCEIRFTQRAHGSNRQFLVVCMFGLLERDSLENSLRPEHENGNNTGSRGAGKRIRCHIFVGRG